MKLSLYGKNVLLSVLPYSLIVIAVTPAPMPTPEKRLLLIFSSIFFIPLPALFSSASPIKFMPTINTPTPASSHMRLWISCTTSEPVNIIFPSFRDPDVFGVSITFSYTHHNHFSIRLFRKDGILFNKLCQRYILYAYTTKSSPFFSILVSLTEMIFPTKDSVKSPPHTFTSMKFSV